ncbi:MAG: glucose-1-phosphate thymidylyltransferase, partial [Lachnospiraceae bacterium]|nr:glucose-1-phosphate thymidylyltransferase [Lachnospiraceae bacterium]
TWLDTGTHESLVDATNFVKTVETHQHRKIACIEEIAYNHGWMSREMLEQAYELYKKNQYGAYIKDILDGKYIDR